MHRHPFATDAYELGYAVGVREDYSYQIDDLPNVNLPVTILDNDFRNPDLDRYLDRFEEIDPSVGILGDAYTRYQAEELNQSALDLLESYPYKELVVVPKCREAIHIFDDDLVLGYAMGYSDIQAQDFSKPVDWRGRRVHLLGASPHKQYNTIQDLIQPTLTGEPSADIVGLDWNGIHQTALKGEYWTQEGWQPADHLTIRETVRKSLKEIKKFWQDKDIWPEIEPIDLCGMAVEIPDDPVYAVSGADIQTREQMEEAFIEEYPYNGEARKMAFQNESEKQFFEYRAGLL